MNKCVFAIGSVTYAMRAQRALADSSVPSKVVKTKNEQRGRGCTYGVEVDCMYKNTAIRLLDSFGISYDTVSE